MSGLATKNAAYQEALAYLYSRIDYERSNCIPARFQGVHLARMRALLGLIGDPQRHLPAVHLAGTKGKGSTAAMVSSILRAADYSVGLYTSPHLDRLEERLVVNGQPCGESDLVELVQVLRPAVDDLDRRSPESAPTFFELTTALAMLHFSRQEVDIAVFEVGMGGRLDSTNLCEPLVSVITNISFDHMKQLGNTLAAIAGEKAGIIKPSVPVVSGVTCPEPRDVVRAAAESQRCTLTELGAAFDFEYRAPDFSKTGIPTASFSYRERIGNQELRYDDIELPLLGRHQAANAAIALAVMQQLEIQGLSISERALRTGLQRIRIPSRVEVVSREPTVIVDTAHNVASVEALIDVLAQIPPAPRRFLIFATTVDKDAGGMLERLVKRFDSVILTRYVENPRGFDPHTLAELANEAARKLDVPRPQITVCDNPSAAWEYYRQRSRSDDLVCIAGSFFLAAEARRCANL